MSNFSEMEWNAKWDWENLVESPKKTQLGDWRMIVEDAEINPESFNLSGNGCNNNNNSGSSAKSSISASTDSDPNFRFMTFEGSSGNFSKKMEMRGTEVFETSSLLEASVEPFIGLKLGKRTYFENKSTSSLSVMPTPSSGVVKKKKSPGSNTASIPCCQVEGCNIDLSNAKEYHIKHRVCDEHSKCPKVIIRGVERRFCQQCSRFHSLSEFDGKKRSCRKRLSDHNARRRKPQQETIQFNPTSHMAPFYGGRHQTSFVLNNNNTPLLITPSNSTYNSKFTITKGYPLKANGDEGMNMIGNASKNSTSEVFNTGSHVRLDSSSHFDASPAYEGVGALSLLSSNNPWGSQNVPLHDSTINHTLMHDIPEGVPLSSSEFWLMGNHSTNPASQSLATNNYFQQGQIFKRHDKYDFYSNVMN